MSERREGEGSELEEIVSRKLQADLQDLGQAIRVCRRCASGGRGVPGAGVLGADVLFLAGRPGPGAEPGNPWGAWWDRVRRRLEEEWGWRMEGVYLSTALRCHLKRITRLELGRCAPFLAEELLAVGPRLVVVSGRVAAVALRLALGDEVPEEPRAGDTFSLYSMRFLFQLDVARVEREREAAEAFWRIMRGMEGMLTTGAG